MFSVKKKKKKTGIRIIYTVMYSMVTKDHVFLSVVFFLSPFPIGAASSSNSVQGADDKLGQFLGQGI